MENGLEKQGLEAEFRNVCRKKAVIGLEEVNVCWEINLKRKPRTKSMRVLPGFGSPVRELLRTRRWNCVYAQQQKRVNSVCASVMRCA
jgi:hypothetical protein